MTVLRVRRKETICDPAISGLVLRAIEAIDYPGTTSVMFLAEMCARIAADELGLFVGYQDEAPRALVVAFLPTSQAMMAPQVVLVYNEASPALARRVGERLKAWLMAAGYRKLVTLNLRHPDPVLCRALTRLGTPRRLGSLFELEF